MTRIRTGLGAHVTLLVRKHVLFLLYFLLCVFPHNASSAESSSSSVPEPDESAIIAPIASQNVDDEGEGTESLPIPVLNQGEARIGYNYVNTDGIGSSAAGYSALQSSLTGGLFFSSLAAERKFSLEGNFSNDKEYFGDLYLDHQGNYRLNLRTESFFNQTDNERLFAPPYLFYGSAIPQQTDNGIKYGLRVEQDLAEIRYKPFNYPLHLGLGYWRQLREGNSQLRYADYGFGSSQTNPVPVNNVFAVNRKIDRQTHEGNFNVDSHLGPIDLIYNFQIRQQLINEPQLTDFFAARANRIESSLPHNVDPETRYTAHTVKVHSSLTGGFVGAASYTYGKRENQTAINGIDLNGKTGTTINSAAGDFTYTLTPKLLFALRYRHYNSSATNPATLTSPVFTPGQTYPFSGNPGLINTPNSIDITRDVVTFNTTYRPITAMTLVGEYRAELLQRGHLESPDNIYWNLPSDSLTQRGTFSFQLRPVKGLRLKAQYSYSSTDNPSYGDSAGQRHAGEALVTYNSLNSWGLSTSYRAFSEWNDNYPVKTRTSVPVTYQFPRDKSGYSASASVWITPINEFTLSANYNYLNTSIDQTVLLNGITPGVSSSVAFRSEAQIYSISMAYNYNELLEMALALQHIRSSSDLDPGTVSGSGTDDSSLLGGISSRKTVENALSFRTEYRFAKNYSISANYSLQSYIERDSSLFDGTVHFVGTSLTARW